MVEVFMCHSMVDAKRKIKKELVEAQSLVDKTLEQELRDANRVLKRFVDEKLKGWENINGNKFELAYPEFEKNLPLIQKKINEKKE